MSIIECAQDNDFLFPTHCLELPAFEFRVIFYDNIQSNG